MTLLNAVLLAFPSPYILGSENQVVIQDNLNERLKLVPAVPKLYRMNVLLMNGRRNTMMTRMSVSAR